MSPKIRRSVQSPNKGLHPEKLKLLKDGSQRQERKSTERALKLGHLRGLAKRNHLTDVGGSLNNKQRNDNKHWRYR
jgi:hypothetical protein